MPVFWEQSDKTALEPVFEKEANDLLTRSPYIWRVVYGFRTYAEQDRLYQIHLAGGPLAAPPGHSAHEFGLAIDVQLLVEDQEIWNTKHPGWQWLFANVRSSRHLHSGVDFGDFDHIERYNWHAFRNWAKDAVPTQATHPA